MHQRLISEEMMQEFPYIEHLKQRGARETYLNNILSVLTKRFPRQDVQPVRLVLESIDDLDHLSDLHLMSIDTSSVEEFLRALTTSDE